MEIRSEGVKAQLLLFFTSDVCYNTHKEKQGADVYVK